jgi:rhomboid protease GluP
MSKTQPASARPDRSTRPPWLTAGVLVVTAVVSTVGLLAPAVLEGLERRGGELSDAEPWRLLTSLVVHDSWPALGFNLLLLGIVGVAVERRHPRTEWTTLYVGAGLVGELAGIAWQPHGAGNSVAALGLAGVLVVDAVRRRDPSLLALGYATVVLLMLLSGDVGGVVGTVISVLTCLAAGASVATVRRLDEVPRFLAPAVGGLALVVAVVLVVCRDIHGPALLTGVALALLWDLTGGEEADMGRGPRGI